VGWKVDWALRWYSLGIDYEMAGKDLMGKGLTVEIKDKPGAAVILYKRLK
jgi:lysyl-tRNA synthetase class I